MRRWVLLVLVVLLVLATGCGKRGPATMKSYPGDAAGLRALMSDFAAAGSSRLAQEMGASLVLADAESFFATYWPPDVAARLAAEYAAHPPSAAALMAFLAEQKVRGRTDALVEKFDQVADENATGYQEYALKEETRALPLYSFRLRLPDGSSPQHLYNFVHVSGAWKYAGPMKSIKEGLMNDPRLDALASLRAKDRQAYFNTGQLPD